MTQIADVLEILKQNATTGISPEEIRGRRWTPQYNRVISDLRDQGHLIVSAELRRNGMKEGIAGFFYCGRFGDHGFEWYTREDNYPPRIAAMAVDEVLEFELGIGRYARRPRKPKGDSAGWSGLRFLMD